MDLHTTVRALHAEVRAKKHLTRFEEARARHPALRPYALPAAILTVLDIASGVPLADKDRLTRALATEYAEQPSPLWAAILAIAYGPMLGRIRARICAAFVPSPEIDQIILTSFLQVVAALPRDAAVGHTCAALRRRTQHRVFEQVRRARRAHSLVELVEPDRLDSLPVAPSTAADPGWQAAAGDLSPLADYLARTAGGVVKRAEIDLVLQTLIRREPLPAYVRRCYPGVEGADRRRLYERLKRRRSRAVARLQDR